MAASRTWATALVSLSFLAAACAPVGGGRSETGPARGPEDSRTLVVATHFEPTALVHRSLVVGPTGGTPAAGANFFHAGLSMEDDKKVFQPYLAETLPQLGTDSWKVFPEGQMETTWRLRPNLTWHDGAPVVADDFALSVQARITFRTGGTTGGGTTLARLVDQVIVADPRTLVVRWKEPYPLVGESDWQPLPHHVLGSSLLDLPIETFTNQPYWTSEFVGAGPYHLERWEPGAFIEGSAFPGYVHGRPKVGRVQIVFIADPNTVMANLLAGAVHLTTDNAFDFEQGMVLKRQSWPGSILLSVNGSPYAIVQYKSEYMNPRALLDTRVRQAMAHSIDKQAIVDAVLDGEPGIAHTIVPSDESYFPDLDRALTKYLLDLRRSEQLMLDAGFRKDGEGFFGQGGDRLSTQIQAERLFERLALILADSWKRAGIDAPIRLLSTAEARDNELNSIFPSLSITTGTGDNRDKFYSEHIATAEKRWVGGNRGGYADPEYDRLYTTFRTSLDVDERNRASVQALKLLSDQSAMFPLFYNFRAVAVAPGLTGPRASAAIMGVHEWHWK